MLYFVEKWIEKKYFSIKNNLALYDQLTGIYNYNWFTKFGLEIFSDKEAYITLMDLNNFKQINDTKGHMYANEILFEIVKKLNKIVSKEDPEAVMIRYGGDEFVILLPGDTGDRARSMSRIILKKMNTGLIKQITEYADEDVVIPEDKKLSGSIGIAISDDGKRENLAAALARADAALYEIKRNGKSGYLVGEK